MATPVDLKKVGQLFDETITAIRDGTPDTNGLEPQAIAWLKDARYKVMRKTEASYYELFKARDAPLLQPRWVNPSKKLYVSTEEIPTILLPYSQLFADNLVTLLKDCGFQIFGTVLNSIDPKVFLSIRFPLRPRVEPPALPKILRVEDEFSGAAGAEGSGFSASKFGQLLIGARGQDTGSEAEGADSAGEDDSMDEDPSKALS
ncbi:hypothetical protein B0H17DRAFT_1333741 [Mycena rosella]|uniref:Uncharacterized protein n=1 Tax=Mycena rosella TaxID=1033263 RepID=A0AAD7GC70_MYCRO|nr:hypothetical protein B0H17DRAFT_1333741 [Mycena rosella]